MANIPNKSNCFSTIGPGVSLRQVAELYRAAGWSVRQSGWTEYEIECEWAELVLDDAQPLLLHGAVADFSSRVEEVFAPLIAAGVTFSVDPPEPSP